VRTASNPLADYMDSLRLVGRLQAELVLPGHGEPFAGLPQRVDELLQHHERRLDEIIGLLDPEDGHPRSAFELASKMRWSSRRTWDDLSGFERRMAVTETLAHTELLHSRAQIAKRFEAGVVTYVRRATGTTSALPAETHL
jgi:glyoxylase-like metal-dependent hydrolase (beta-lactamase superfamily II)